MEVDEKGMVVVRGRLTPEVGAVLLRAVEAGLEQVPAPAEGEQATLAQRRADALGLVAESALAGGLDPGSAGDRFQVTVHVPAEALASRQPATAAPGAISAETRAASRAAAEATVPAQPYGKQVDVTRRGRRSGRRSAARFRGRVRARRGGVGASGTGNRPRRRSGGDRASRRTSRRPRRGAPRGLRFRPGGAGHGSDGEVLDAGRRPVPSPPPCAASCRTAIVTSASSPAARAATATPITSCTGPTVARLG